MTTSYDAIIIGGGHNGLVCGAYLARGGRKVCVLERREVIGGAAVSETVWPGYRVSVASYTMALLQPRIIQELELARHGYAVIRATPMLHLYGEGRSLIFGDDAQVHAGMARYSAADAAAYPRYREHMARLGATVSRMLWEIPPDPAARDLSSRLRLLGFAWRYRNIGEQFYDLYDVLTLSARDFLGRWFQSDEAIAALGFYVACGGATTTLSAPGSAYVLLRGYVRDHTTPAGPAGFVRGGMGSISEAIAAAGKAHGMEVRLGAPVTRVNVEGGRATGVTLESGETLRAACVVSNAATKVLFRKLLDPSSVPQEFLQRVDRIRDTSHAFKVNLAMNRLPVFKDFDAASAGFDYPTQVRIAPSVDYLEQAYDAARHGMLAPRLPLVVLTPSMLDPSVAPPGKHLMSIFGQHVPYRLLDHDRDMARDRLRDTVFETLEVHAPGFRDCVDHVQVLAPQDLEERFALPGGHVHHGELSADQIFFRRPVRGAADYRTPIAGLYQCGASVHPGGGVTGVPGHNAARVILSGSH
jgi:phytoene dehydrogenase-like protein